MIFSSSNHKMKNLKAIVAYALFVAILVAGVFGFAGMNHMSMNCNPDSDSTCPPSQIGMVLHHLSADGSLIQAVMPTVTEILAGFIIIALAVSFSLRLSQAFSNSRLSFSRFRSQKKRPPDLAQKTILSRWLSLFENSPAILLRH